MKLSGISAENPCNLPSHFFLFNYQTGAHFEYIRPYVLDFPTFTIDKYSITELDDDGRLAVAIHRVRVSLDLIRGCALLENDNVLC